MKTSRILILLSICFLIVSCEGGNSEVNPIKGTWYTFERTVYLSSETYSSDAEYLEERINVYFEAELEEYDITKYYNDETVKTVTTLKSDPSELVSETEFTYAIEGDTITIDDRIYGTMSYEYILTNKIMTMYGKLNKQRVENIADQLGITISIPEDITGTIKIKDYR